MSDRIAVVHRNFVTRLGDDDLPQIDSAVLLEDTPLSAPELVDIYHAQVLSRQLDRQARQLQSRGQGFYTIGSSGHENTAAIAAAFRPTDMAFLHYRDAAFQIQRARQVGAQDPAWDIMLSLVASAEDPISGGRHKVLGSLALAIPPQTSTIASHLPKAVGAAYSIGLARRRQPPGQRLAPDGVILCSFGDASANHSTAQGAFNTASWTAYQNIPMPLLFICEDNGIGISTRTPKGWIASMFAKHPELRYFHCNGLDPVDTWMAAHRAEQHVRRTRRPAVLHFECVRLFGHAGADTPGAYLTRGEIEQAEANDPLLYTASRLRHAGILDSRQLLAVYTDTGDRLDRMAERAVQRPKLASVAEVKSSLVPPGLTRPDSPRPDAGQRQALFGRDFEEMRKPQHMARQLSWALADLMLEHRQVVLAGEDIGPKGGVYNVTAKLHDRFGPDRVINTLLDEQSILGLAIGLAHNGFLPIPEIQFLAYLHNAEDQLRGEAATLSFFSNGQFTNPMVIRIAGLGYQKGFGGHFHNDNSIAVLRDIPGVVIACPSNGGDAVHMLRECVRLALQAQRVVVFLEPIALYMTRDLHRQGDGTWTSVYPAPGSALEQGAVGQHGNGTQLALVSYANGYYLSRQAGRILREQHGIELRIIDLRWLAPLPEDSLRQALDGVERVLVVDECRRSGSISEALMALLQEHYPHLEAAARLTAEDCFIPLGTAATLPLPNRDGIVAAALALIEKGKSG